MDNYHVELNADKMDKEKLITVEFNSRVIEFDNREIPNKVDSYNYKLKEGEYLWEKKILKKILNSCIDELFPPDNVRGDVEIITIKNIKISQADMIKTIN